MTLHSHSTILLVEDDEVDVEFFRRALKKKGIANPLVTAQDGVAALDILQGREGNAMDKPEPPVLLILDINMPRMNGFELLSEIRQDASLAGSTVFFLTTSSRGEDRDQARALKASGYYLKEDTAHLMEEIRDLVSNEAG